MTAILGISAFYHDAAAALVVDGRIVAAAEEERFSRKKHDFGFPARAIASCLDQAQRAPEAIDYVAFYDKPLLKFDRLLETYLAFAPRGFQSFSRAMPLWLRQKLHLRRELDRGLGGAYRRRYVFTHHHESHAASAFFPSPFEEAAILTLDGVGEWSTASMGVGRGNKIELSHELRFPHSLGLLYSAFTYFTGFKVNYDEYKLMGLAPYGEPRYVDLLREKIVDVREDGSLHLDLSYFNYCHGLTMTSRKMDRLFGGPPRPPEAPITEREIDLAASIQQLTEDVVLKAARALHARTGMRNLCMAGGVALNCVANGRVLRDGPFDDIWIQPAAGDAGGALGAALFVWYQLLGKPRIPESRDAMQGALLGPAFDDKEVLAELTRLGARFERYGTEETLCEHVAAALDAGQVVGWFQGRMEFGPRALGARSILADPRQPEMQAIVNQKVKFREGFRPFAPAVLQEHVHEWFATRNNEESPYMLLVAPVHESRRLATTATQQASRGLDKLKIRRSTIPAVTHVDQSARIQTVDVDRNPIYRRLLEAFERRTGCPVLVNTSFNLSWEPIVCTPAQAYRTFMASNLDMLCIGSYVLAKTAQPAWVDGTPNRAATGQALRALLDRGWHDRLAHALDTSLPYNSPVVVVGEGIADLVHLLGVACRKVVGVETNATLLHQAEKFARDNDLNRVQFIHASLNQLPFGPSSCESLVVLERQPIDRDVLAHLVETLLPGGHLFVLQAHSNVGHLVRQLEGCGARILRGVPPLVSEPDDAEPGSLLEMRPAPTSLDLVIARLRRRLGGGSKGTLLGDLRFLVVAQRRSDQPS